MRHTHTTEHQRLLASQSRQADWKNWGPYVSDRAWGTVREDYSQYGEAWDFFPHDHARSRAYRWNEDGLAGVCNRFQNINLGLGLWNERDPIIKERFFGLTGPQGNHSEDVKEYYYYLDSTPTHSYMKMLYKYPQVEYPYGELLDEARRRSRRDPEFELVDALHQAFAEGRYFDVFVEYAKADEEDILCRITAINRGPDPAPIHVLPHIWYRNTWSWGYNRERPEFRAMGDGSVHTTARHLGDRWWYAMTEDGHTPELLFTENETNTERLWGSPNKTPYVKDSINDYIVHGQRHRVNPARQGSKTAAHFQAMVPPGGTYTIYTRFSDKHLAEPFDDADAIFSHRIQEADEFYNAIQDPGLTDDERSVQRQAFAGMMWSKQFYHLSIELWLQGDPAFASPPAQRKTGRNADWTHLYNLDVLSMPDKWEYPWYAAWDLAFHTPVIAMIDPEWAKRQLILLLREWYMHPNGQIPAYEWAFGDVNPPVHAWAAMEVYKIDRDFNGVADTQFLEQVFHKLLLNFTWWVNRKDAEGHNIFQGGFLGLDNIGVFDRSAPLPVGGHLDQADGTAWMGMYCLDMLAIALELARTKPAYEDVATKFFEHFIYIADAIYKNDGNEVGLWDDEDGFFYDVLHFPDGSYQRLKVLSFVGLIPLFAVTVLDHDTLNALPQFRRRMEWFLKYRPWLTQNIASLKDMGMGASHLFAIVGREKLARILTRMLDETRFLSDYGLRSISRRHLNEPYVFQMAGQTYTVQYEPAESSTGLFGGNSNWRGPIWMPVNYLLLEGLRRFDRYYGDTFQIECPTGSGNYLSLGEVADEIGRRLSSIFLRDEQGRRAVFGREEIFQNDPHWREYPWFYEYFNGDDGSGVGASHQTGWTGLVAILLQRAAAKRRAGQGEQPEAMTTAV